MFGIFTQIFKWLFSKAALLITIWAVVLVAVALYLWSQKYLEKLPAELAEKEAILERVRREAGQLDERMAALKTELDQQIALLDEKRKALQDNLKMRQAEFQNWQAQLERMRGVGAKAVTIWDKLRGVDKDQYKEEIRNMEIRIAANQKRQTDLRQQVSSADAEQKALEEATGAREAELERERQVKHGELALAESEHSEVKVRSDRWESRVNRGQDLLVAAYERMGKPLIIISLSVIFLPILAKIALFYFWAPMLSLGRPVIIRSPAQAPVRVSETEVAQEVVLEPEETATIQHRFYQASDEDLSKRTKFVFNWHYPFSCLACGLFLLTRVSNRNAEAKRRLTLSSQSEAEIEMAVVEVPQGGSIICRPSFVAALIHRSGEEPQIRSHWRFFSLHAWITLQFRYFEFRGPVRLVLWAYRGIRAERLTLENVTQGNERRTNQLATIGFTPSLSYRSRRSETFISYLRDQNPLFDDLFSGQGVFLCQQISRAEHHRQAGNFWAKMWNGLTKIVGI